MTNHNHVKGEPDRPRSLPAQETKASGVLPVVITGLVLALPVLQLLAYHRAMVNGLDPDQPRNLAAVVTL